MRTRTGITLVETVIGTLLVGGVLAATLQIIGPTVRSGLLAGDEMIASTLVAELVSEISAQPFEDPVDADGSIGPETGEATSTRAGFDDVDDYHAWSARPQTTTGVITTDIPSSWSLEVTVEYVDPDAPSSVSLSDTGVKRVRVRARKAGVLLGEAVVLRTRGFDSALEEGA